MRTKIPARRVAVVLVFLTILISGCWDVVDLDRRTIIIGLGLDAEPGNMVKATAQIPLVESSPNALRTQASNIPFHSIASQAETALGAAQGIDSKAVKSIYWGQLKVVVFNTALAERGLKKYGEFLLRHSEIPPTSYLALTETISEDILSVGLASKFLPATAIDNYFSSKSKADEVYPIRIWQFIKAIETRPKDAYLPIISFDKEEKVYRIADIGVFRRDRLVGKLSENETRMAGILMGKSSYATSTVPIGKMGEISYRRIKSRCKITLLRTKPNIGFLITVKAKGFGSEITSDKTELSNEEIKAIERAIEKAMKKGIADTLRRLQQLNSDIVGFGDIVRIAQPETWKKIKDHWYEDFAQASFKVNVKFKLERVGKYR